MHSSLRPCRDGSRWWTGCLLALLFVVSGGAPARADPPRIALVIGNSAYGAGVSLTSLRDAGLVARALSQAGFAVTAAGDVDRGRLESLLDGFLAEAANAGPGATIVVYLAGYGLQHAGSVYVVPAGAILARDGDIPGEAISVSAFMSRLEALPATVRVFLLDLARETPFPLAGASVAGGLPLIQPGPGTIVAMNAAPGTVAVPNVPFYGIYARALAEVIATTSLPVSVQLERVRLRIGRLTNGTNVPWNSGTIDGAISLGARGVASPPSLRASVDAKSPASQAEVAYLEALARDTLDVYTVFLANYPDDPLAARVRAMVAVRRETVLWDETLRADLDRAYWTYMRRYPRGPHVADAKRRLAMLHTMLEPPSRFDIYYYTSAAPPLPWEEQLVDRPFIVLQDPTWRRTPVTDADLPAPVAAFYDDLPPPSLALPGAVPVADAVWRRQANLVTQPDVPSVGTIVCDTRLDPDGAWRATSLVDDKLLFVTRASNPLNGAWTWLQTDPDGTVLSKTIITHDRGTTTIVQTGPDGGILTKAVTRGDGAGGRSTVLTNGGNQLIALVQADAQGVTTAKRGPVAQPDPILVLGTKPGEKLAVALARTTAPAPNAEPEKPYEPQPPPPLVMPVVALPVPVAPANPAQSSITPGKIAPAAPSLPTVTKPAPRPVTELPKIAPLPPRRLIAPARPHPAPPRKASPLRRP